VPLNFIFMQMNDAVNNTDQLLSYVVFGTCILWTVTQWQLHKQDCR